MVALSIKILTPGLLLVTLLVRFRLGFSTGGSVHYFQTRWTIKRLVHLTTHLISYNNQCNKNTCFGYNWTLFVVPLTGYFTLKLMRNFKKQCNILLQKCRHRHVFQWAWLGIYYDFTIIITVEIIVFCNTKSYKRATVAVFSLILCEV